MGAQGSMTFNSFHFLLFFPIVVLVYFAIPRRWKNPWLLVCSYYFYMSWNPKYVVLIAASTLITWWGGLRIGRAAQIADERVRRRRKKLWIALCLTGNLAILGFFKYYGFLSENIERALSAFNIRFTPPRAVDVLLPVGISFYTFQALGYIIDVYRGTVAPEENLLQYALFISFFPQLVAGPIERSRNLIRQIHEAHTFDGDRVARGLLLMGWGFFKKLVIADRAAMLVTAVYGNYNNYTGLQIIIATIFFAIQIYCDFSGYSDIAVGAAQVLGFRLMENFNCPYFATSVADFWRRWHISLSTWFRDYLYIPLGGNRCETWKKYRNLLITFGVSGLWHGASWNFVAWGLLNGLYQVAGDLTKKLRASAARALRIDTQRRAYRFLQGIVTFALIDFAWLFFRADSFHTALSILRRIAEEPALLSLPGVAVYLLGNKNFLVLFLAVALLFTVDRLKGRVHFRTLLLQQNIAIRYFVYYCIIFGILIFGIYGPEYDASTFIYFQF